MTSHARSIKPTQPVRSGVKPFGQGTSMWSPQSPAPIAWPMPPARIEAATAPRMAASNPAPMLSSAEVADRLGVCVETICREARASNLAASKVGGQWRISEEGLARYLAGIDKPLRLYSRSRKKGSPS